MSPETSEQFDPTHESFSSPAMSERIANDQKISPDELQAEFAKTATEGDHQISHAQLEAAKRVEPPVKPGLIEAANIPGEVPTLKSKDGNIGEKFLGISNAHLQKARQSRR